MPEYFVLIIRHAFLAVKPTFVPVLKIFIYWDGFIAFGAWDV